MPRRPLPAPERSALAQMRLVDVVQNLPEAIHVVAYSEVPRAEWGSTGVRDVPDPDALLDALASVTDWRGAAG